MTGGKPEPEMCNRVQAEKIRSLKKTVLGLEDRHYRELLAPYSVDSALKLTTQQANQFIADLEDRYSQYRNLFRSVFRGREDVVAERWESSKSGKSGYSPICENDWVKDVCQKLAQKGCRKCPNAKYVPMSDKLLTDHFEGTRVLGIYPLLPENTCNFVAGDFDNHTGERDPLRDVESLHKLCQAENVPCYVLKSRSGKGYHAYVFFEEPVPAWKGRAVYFALLRKAGVISNETEISSFDRLFPCQDTRSGKNLGNLISLPFQGVVLGRAGKGQSRFLDPHTDFMVFFENQWGVLARIEKITEAQLDLLIEKWNLVDPSTATGKKSTEDFDAQHDFSASSAPADFDKIKQECQFLNHCITDASSLSEPEWYSLLSISVRCVEGRAITHKISEPYPNYSAEETDAKIAHALNDTGPYTCTYIEMNVNGAYCKDCKHYGQIKSPIVLGMPGKPKPLSPDAEIKAIMKLNKEHAVVMLGGKCVILNEFVDPTFNRPAITFSRLSDFKARYSNRSITLPPKHEGGDPTTVRLADLWLNSSLRRQYDGVVFAPGITNLKFFNLWRGFAVQPRKGDWRLFRDHIFKIIANENEEIYRYVMAWLARLVQDPGGERPGTSLALRGPQGSGKGCFVNIFGSILASHFLHITNQNLLVGRFNRHLTEALLVFVDEGFWAGHDKAAEGVLKGLITEDYLMAEPKGIDAFPIRNLVNVIIASNNSWVVPAGLEERRFFCIDVSDCRARDTKYFKTIFGQMDDTGKAAMLYDLLDYDISGVDLRTFPRTDALLDQIVDSMSTVQKFWYERLRAGSLSAKKNEWEGWIPTETLYEEYLEFAESIGDKNRLINRQFTKELKKLCPGAAGDPSSSIIRRRRQMPNRTRAWGLEFPELEECRKQFENRIRMQTDWED